MVEIAEIKKVLSETKTIIKHHRELTIAKGEHFNLFSVLKIQTRENNTHSAFLAELLNPNGSHDMGDIFLRLFLTTVNHNEKFEFEKDRIFNSDKAFVKVEQVIGRINLRNKEGEDSSRASGGRIDIYLKDKNRNMISIENKIHADDQEAQIQRYCNHKKNRNTVYYLTLKGEDPSEYSKLKLESDEDFYSISYRTHIIEWLELCLKEVPNFTSLRESINQYILLIKKLTHILNKEQEEELFNTMIKNIEASRFIVDNYDNMINKLRHRFRDELKTELSIRLNSKHYLVDYDKKVGNKYSQLWIHFMNNPVQEIKYGVEPFSGIGHGNGEMFVGLYDKDNSPLLNNIKDENRLTSKWRYVRYIKTKSGNDIKFNDNFTLKKLSEKEGYQHYIELFAIQIVDFILEYQKQLPKNMFPEN